MTPTTPIGTALASKFLPLFTCDDGRAIVGAAVGCETAGGCVGVAVGSGAVAVGVGVAVAVAVEVGVKVAVGVGVAVGAGWGTMTTPFALPEWP